MTIGIPNKTSPELQKLIVSLMRGGITQEEFNRRKKILEEREVKRA